MRTDLTVFAKDFPEARLVVEIKANESDLDKSLSQVARFMWGSNCHFGLIITPAQTFVLRDDFTRSGPEAIQVTDTLPTATLLSRIRDIASAPVSEQQLETAVREWLQRLVDSYESALPEDPEIARVFFPDIVGAVDGGRIVSEVAA
jgi:hypothetical protein